MNRIIPLALALLAIVAFTACTGGTANPSGVASLGSQSPAPATSTEPEASVDPEDAALAFAQCMREHGVDMPDPQVGSNGEMSFSIGAGPGKLDRSKLQEAQEACQDLMPTGLGKPGEIPQEQRDAMLAFAQCMREHGIDMPDPQFETGGMVMIGGPDEDGAGPKFDPRSEQFQAAEEACGDLLGEMRPGSAPSMPVDATPTASAPTTASPTPARTKPRRVMAAPRCSGRSRHRPAGRSGRCRGASRQAGRRMHPRPP